MFTHFTKIGQLFTTTEGRFANNQVQALFTRGIDPLQIQVDFCKRNHIEIFSSMRMNDTHDGDYADYGPIMFRANKLKNEHPEFLLGTQKRPPKYGSWTAVDYGRSEIRELAFRYVDELCHKYDIDGLELDFFRHPVFFQSTSRGEPATDEERRNDRPGAPHSIDDRRHRKAAWAADSDRHATPRFRRVCAGDWSGSQKVAGRRPARSVHPFGLFPAQ